MLYSDLRREDNYNEYLRLSQNDDYLDVTFDEESGGMSAVHRLHKFAKKPGINGKSQGDYERAVLAIMRKSGHRIVLESETNRPGVKSCDGYLDDVPLEIKAIEGKGTWAICSKLLKADKQKAQCVVLYFPDKNLFSAARIEDGIGKYKASPDPGKGLNISRLLAISEDGELAVWDKKATPIEGWSVWEGFRR